MNYGQHGMGHGHFDTLGITLFNRAKRSCASTALRAGSTSRRNSAAATCPRTRAGARQTVAHNCVVVDRQSQNGFEVDRAERVHGQPHFFVGSGPLQAMSALPMIIIRASACSARCY